MSDNVFQKLAKVLNTLPNGFPPTESGVELKLLEKVFLPEEAELFCDLRLEYETVDDIAKRSGRPLDGLEEMLTSMAKRGQIFMVNMGGTKIFKMLPWIFGIYEFQLNRLDREFVELNEELYPVFGKQFFDKTPQLMQTLPIEQELTVIQEALPFERVSNIVENSQSFMLFDCVCKKEQGLIDNPCNKPIEVCMAFAPLPGIFDDSTHGHAITRDEAKAVLNKAEEAGLVHLTSNFQNGHFYICNCCGCCCGVLSAINKLGLPAQTVINSHYFAVINSDDCTVCGTCADERCQINAIEEGDEFYRIDQEKCIGCGLCITTCPGEAISLHRREEKDIQSPPIDEADWYKQRGKTRGVDFSKYQ